MDLISTTDKNKVFIFFSGLGVDVQSTSKRVRYIAKVENYVLDNLKKAIIFKPSIVLGDGDQFIGKLLPIFKLSFFIPLFGTGEVKLQPVFVDDVANAVATVLERNVKCSKIYELVGPEVFTYKNFYQFIIDCLGLKRKFVHIPFGLALIIASIVEKMPLDLITKDQLLLFKEDNIFSNQHKKFSDLGILPKDIREIIKKLL